jgi:hypothetical protein
MTVRTSRIRPVQRDMARPIQRRVTGLFAGSTERKHDTARLAKEIENGTVVPLLFGGPSYWRGKPIEDAGRRKGAKNAGEQLRAIKEYLKGKPRSRKGVSPVPGVAAQLIKDMHWSGARVPRPVFERFCRKVTNPEYILDMAQTVTGDERRPPQKYYLEALARRSAEFGPRDFPATGVPGGYDPQRAHLEAMINLTQRHQPKDSPALGLLRNRLKEVNASLANKRAQAKA